MSFAKERLKDVKSMKHSGLGINSSSTIDTCINVLLGNHKTKFAVTPSLARHQLQTTIGKQVSVVNIPNPTEGAHF